jgi:Zn-dependent protease with chaperone function
VTESLALLVYAAGAGTAGAAMLRGARWTRRAPGLGVAAWQVLSGSILAAVLLAGLVVVVPAGMASASLAEFLHACVMALRAQYATPGGAVVHAGGALVTVVLAIRTGYLLGSGLRGARRARAEHLRSLRLVARRDVGLDALVVDHPAAAAYCLPGRDATVVLTSSAVAALVDRELAAVLAHERAHLHGRHHLVAAASAALAQALPFVPGLAWARTEQAKLLEMIADDAAARAGDRLCVARALVSLAGVGVPAAALGAGDIAGVSRVERLMRPAARLGLVPRLAVTAAMTLTALAPVAIAATPAVAAAHMQYCPVSSSGTPT